LAVKISKDLQGGKIINRDEYGNVLEAVDKNGDQHKYEYDATGFTETVVAKGTVSVKRFDKKGRMTAENKDGQSRIYHYLQNAQGAVEKIAVEQRTSAGVMNLEYDLQGRLVSSEFNGVKDTITYGGDKTFTVKTAGQNGALLKESVFKAGLLQQVKLSDGTVKHFEYLTDSTGKILATTEVKEEKDGKKTVTKYDQEGKSTTSWGGNDDNRMEKMSEETDIQQQALGFEAEKSQFSDHRMDNMRLDKKVLMGVQQQQ
jgi:YD repeat-containing protein